MASFPPLDVARAQYDRFREAVVVPCGLNQLVLCHDALEEFVGRRLSRDEALDAAIDDQATFRAVANATPAYDNVITVTRSILARRSWDAEPYDDGPEDSGPIYLDASNRSFTS